MNKTFPRLRVRRTIDGLIWRVTLHNFPSHVGTVIFEAREFEDARQHVVYELKRESENPRKPRLRKILRKKGS